MSAKKYVGEVISIRYKDRKTSLTGMVIDYNDDWTLLKSNPADFVVDGYKIFRHKNIEAFKQDFQEEQVQKVLYLKGINISDKELIPLDNLETILSYLSDRFGLFLLELKAEDAGYVGKLKTYNTSQVVITSMNTEGEWEEEMTFRPGDIRTIEFESDYLQSLLLLNKSLPS